jgi:hypothetical protein
MCMLLPLTGRWQQEPCQIVGYYAKVSYDNMYARRVTEAASAATWVSRRAGGAERAAGSGWSPGALGASWCCGAGSNLHQHAHPTEVRLPSLHGQLVIRARSCVSLSALDLGALCRVFL